MDKFSSCILVQNNDPQEIQKGNLDLLMKINMTIDSLNNDITTLNSNIATLTANDFPTGSIMEFAGVTLSSTLWLLCIGTSVSKTTYSALWKVLHSSTRGTAGTGAVTFADTNDIVTCYGHGFSAGDCIHFSAITSTTGISINTNYYVCHVLTDSFRVATTLALALADTETTLTTNGSGYVVYAPWGIADVANFLLPDMREASPYGIGTRGSLVTAHDAAIIGQHKDDQGQGHIHPQFQPTSGIGGSFLVGTGSVGSGAKDNGQTSSPTTDGTNGSPRTGTSTRGKIIGINFIIKT